MTDKELRRLSRAELLELLVEQGKELERAQESLRMAEEQIAARKLMLDEAGSIADASLRITGVFESAQMAADLYLENVKQLSERQNEECARVEQERREKADQLLAETQEECASMKAETEAKCAQMVAQAKAESQRYWDEVSEKMSQFAQQYAGLWDLFSNRP